MSATYLDSSAIVKLVVREAETDALRASLIPQSTLVTSALARTEVRRAVSHLGGAVIEVAEAVLGTVVQVAISDPILDAAGRLEPVALRSLDAIHLSTALALGTDLDVVVTYDHRMATAAEALGLAVEAPGP